MLLRVVFGGLVLVVWFDLLRVCYAAWDWRLLLGFLQCSNWFWVVVGMLSAEFVECFDV